jgi:hypothetical protein
MKVLELIQKLLEFDRDYEVVVAEYYAIDDDNALRVTHNIVGHMVDPVARELIFIIPNKEGKIANEDC